MTRPKKREGIARRGTGEQVSSRHVLKQEEMFPQAVEYSETSMFSGPLPPPDLLYQYNEIVPGAADRIIALAENEAAHRHGIESHLLRIHGRNSTMGVLFGGTIGLSAVVGGTVAMLTGNELSLTGAGVAFSGLASLVAVFFAGRKKQAPPSGTTTPNKPRARRTS